MTSPTPPTTQPITPRELADRYVHDAADLDTMVATGLGLVLSVANVYFRDSAHFVAIGLQVLFYATPVIYPITLVQDVAPDSLVARFHIDSLYMANPVVHFVEAFRDLLYDHQVPELQTLLVVVVSSVVSLVLGWAVFARFSKRLAEEL